MIVLCALCQRTIDRVGRSDEVVYGVCDHCKEETGQVCKICGKPSETSYCKECFIKVYGEKK